jgi:hypothetical protein
VFVREYNAIPVDLNSNGCRSFDVLLVLMLEKCSEQGPHDWLLSEALWQQLQWQPLRLLELECLAAQLH